MTERCTGSGEDAGSDFFDTVLLEAEFEAVVDRGQVMANDVVGIFEEREMKIGTGETARQQVGGEFGPRRDVIVRWRGDGRSGDDDRGG